MVISEKERKTEVLLQTEVAVVGGGIAGIAAALAAARAGKKVLLIEREFLLGGLGTIGLVNVYLPLCDGMGRQVSFGIAEELLRLSVKHGDRGRYPAAWLEDGTIAERAKERFETEFDPCLFELEAEKLLKEAGVSILYGTSVCEVKTENERITHLIVENISGRSAVAVKTVVDASGNAVAAQLAGEETALFAAGNMMAAWFYYLQDGEIKTRQFIEKDYKDKNGGEKLGGIQIHGVDAVENSEALITTHQLLLNEVLSRKNAHDGQWELLSIPQIQQLRMTRRLVGKEEAVDRDHGFCETSIGCIGNWSKRGPAYEIPFGALLAKKNRNLVTAGRCISADGEMWNQCRVIPACAVTGEAAGVAAALSDEPTLLPAKEVQLALEKAGVMIHLDNFYL